MQKKKIITISWKAGREPVDDMFWCEAETEGAWTSITTLERIRTRREIIEKILETDQALIGLDFAFSFPKPFIEFLRNEKVMTDWRSLAKKIREDLKKNTDDGVRIWIERMGKYRESNLEPVEERRSVGRNLSPPGVRAKSPRHQNIPPYERRSLAERFRRIDLILKRKDPENFESTLGIRYNKLTARYEFTDSESRGRAALLGISMLEQLIEAKPEIAIWPFIRPAGVTTLEIYPKMFAPPSRHDPESLKKYFDLEEDTALYVPREVREIVYANEKALEMLFATIGMIKAEGREDKSLRPMRDYRDYFYENEEIRTEGWAFGIGFKVPEKREAEVPETEVISHPSEPQQAPLNELVEEAVAEEVK